MEVKKHMLTGKLMAMIAAYTSGTNAAAPNIIEEDAYVMALDAGCNEAKAQQIASKAHELVAELVKNVGQYL
jgi:hypothetical protein